ncbi:hypothetical protein N5D37_00395 [Comamonas aquatica]|uniref:hypothetical protein n=1 Tax=Comamonas aquatica TaxID=225991 RepID=UPI00244ACFA3|nr:hypothetical protein [Comamonas aquatica]MDH1764180.1 hypothetical protein [Comamonas aquatica]
MNSKIASSTIVTGLAKKVGETKPPKVAIDQTTTNNTKKLTPNSHFAEAETGSKGAQRRAAADLRTEGGTAFDAVAEAG